MSAKLDDKNKTSTIIDGVRHAHLSQGARVSERQRVVKTAFHATQPNTASHRRKRSLLGVRAIADLARLREDESMNLFLITDALDRIERARRGPQGLLDQEWFDAHANGIPPLPSHEGRPSGPIDEWYQAKMKEALNEAFARLRGNVATQSGDRDFPPATTLSGMLEEDAFGEPPMSQQALDRNENNATEAASGGTNVFTSADFDQCVAQRGDLLATLSTPQGRIELCTTGQTVAGTEGSRYTFDVRDGVLLARDAKGDVYSVSAGQGKRARMIVDVDTGQIFADEPGLDI